MISGGGEPQFPCPRGTQYACGTRTGLTFGFGMRPGVSPSLWPSTKSIIERTILFFLDLKLPGRYGIECGTKKYG
jgi:hypothetical protein